MISPQYRAILCDGDSTRERPLQVFGNTLKEMETWAATVLESAPEGSGVNVFQAVEQQVKMIVKPRKKEAEKTK